MTMRALSILSVIAFAACATADESGLGLQIADPLAAGWEGKPVCERLHDDKKQRVLRCTFPPGVGHEVHYHAPHFGYVIAGGRMQITDRTGTRVVETSAGGSWGSEGIVWHEVLNVGKTTTIYLIVEPK